MNTKTHTESTEEKRPTLQDVTLKHYGADNLEQAQKAVEAVINICGQESIEPIFNFDTEQELPEGYGLSIIPLTARVTGKGNVTKGVCIAAVPSVESILNATGGSSWVVKQITALMTRSIKTSAQPTEGEITSIPFKINDFISSSKNSALAAFNAIASVYVSALKNKGLTFINKALLRQVLSSAEFARQQFPRITQDKWEMAITSMKNHAAKEGLEAGILDHWIKTRDQIKVVVNDIDLSDLDAIVNPQDEDGEDGGEEIAGASPATPAAQAQA